MFSTARTTLALALLAVAVTASPALARKAKKAEAPLAAPLIQRTDWVQIDPDNLLIIDTNHGRIVAELYPKFAPKTVEQIKALARRHFYDGLTFFRVIDTFMDQTGDPTNTGQGGSDLPNVPGEFTFVRDQAFPFITVNQQGVTTLGISDFMPAASQSDALMTMTASGSVQGWGLFCAGVLGMARADDPNSGNSQFFLMRGANDGLNHKYTAFGRVLVGMDVVKLIKTGEPVPDPQDKMVRVRLASDLPAGEAYQLTRLSTSSAFYRYEINKTHDAKGADFSPCDMDILTNTNPDLVK